MLLLGRDLSPFVRRTATVLNLLSLPYERKIVNTADDLDTIREFNPLGRIPALQIGDEEVLIDSHAIIDYLLEQGDSQGRLLAKNGELRRATLRHSAINLSPVLISLLKLLLEFIFWY